jgi:hypothetical protein
MNQLFTNYATALPRCMVEFLPADISGIFGGISYSLPSSTKIGHNDLADTRKGASKPGHE